MEKQIAILLLALALWSSWAKPSFAALIVCYLAVWLVLSVALALNARWLRLSLSRAQAILLVVVLLVPSIARAVGLLDQFVETENLGAIDHALGARMRLEETPSIAPPLVPADRPQTFYVHAPGAAAVRVRFGRAGPRLGAHSLGHGVFRVEYDPERDGEPDPPDGELEAILETDGSEHRRTMLAVAPLPHPRWLVPSPDRRSAACVSEETDELYVLDARGLRHRVAVDDGPTDVRFQGAQLVVAHRYSESLVYVDSASGRIVRRLAIGSFAHRLAIDPSGSTIAVAQHGHTPRVLVLREGSPEERIATEFVPDWIAFGSDESTLVASSVQPPALHRFARTESGWHEDRPPIFLGRPAVTMAGNAARLVVAVTDYFPEGPPHLGNHYVQDRLLAIDVAAWTITEHRLTVVRTNRQDSPGNVDRGASPMGIDLLPDGSMWVAFAGTDDVWRFADGEPEPTFFDLDEHPLAAPFSAVALEGGRVLVSSPSYGNVGIFDHAGERRTLVRLAPSDRALLHRNERALQRRIGERGFYESTRSGVSCQSCHLHGGSDGSAHNIGGYSLVATLDTRGLMGTPPYLRDGGYGLLGSLDELAQTVYRGYHRHQGGRRISLERYVESLPLPLGPRVRQGRDEARERRGLDAFVRARCPMCHAPPAFTNLGQHPMEALFTDLAGNHEGYQLDTPSLLGVGQSPPYLVDGRAETLEAIFREHDPATRHGDTARLRRRELDDLLYFLAGL